MTHAQQSLLLTPHSRFFRPAVLKITTATLEKLTALNETLMRGTFDRPVTVSSKQRYVGETEERN